MTGRPVQEPAAVVGLGERAADGPFRPIPPGTANIWVPGWNRRAALAGLALRAPCRRPVVAAHHAAWGLVALAGPRLLPSRPRRWSPPMGPDVWEALCGAWTSAIGGFDGVAVYERPQAARPGVGVLLLRRDRPLAFVKVLCDDSRLEAVWRILRSIGEEPVGSCRVPLPLARGEHERWSWLASAPIPAVPHRPASRPPMASIAAAVRERLRPALDPSGVPEHWQPMHGDMAPWNLRRVGRSLWLLDWDEAGWGPPRADEVYYAVTAALLRGEQPVALGADAETLRFWRDRAERRVVASLDRTYNRALADLLGSMTAAAP